MKMKQLSLFLENKPGHLAKACRILADAHLNVEVMALADTEQFGILRFLIKDWEEAQKVLNTEGIMPRVTDVIAVSVPDQPGGLAGMLGALAGSTVNIEYMYGFNSRRLGESAIVLRLDNPDLAMELFKKNGVRVLTKDELFG